MKSLTEHLWFNTKNKIEFVNITDKVEQLVKKSGVKEVKAVGEPFDPSFHQAVAEKEDPDAEPGTILKVLQKGYTLNERLIRPSMVIVCKGKAESTSPQNDSVKRINIE